jgi:hypothetical protein
MGEILITAMVSMVLGAAGIAAWVFWSTLPKKEKPQELCVDQVLKEADQALAFDPLREAKEKPQAVKPLLQVLLAIREKKAEEELAQEQRGRQWRAIQKAEQRQRALDMQAQEEQQRLMAEQDLLSGRIPPGHPHYPFTREGREEEAHRPKKLPGEGARYSLSAYTDAPDYTKPIGYNALSGVEPAKNSLPLGAIGALAMYANFFGHKRR